MLGEEDLVWKMGWFYFGWRFEQRNCDIGVYCVVRDEINTVVDLRYLYTVVLPVIFVINRLIPNIALIRSLLDQLKHTIIKPRSSTQRPHLLLSQSMLSMHRINHHISSFLHNLLLYLIISIISFLDLRF